LTLFFQKLSKNSEFYDKFYKKSYFLIKRLHIIIFVLIHGFALGQNYNYDVLIDNKIAGKMAIMKSTYINGTILIDFNMEFTVEAIGSNTIKQYATCSFKKGMLTDSEFILERNDRIRESCKIKLLKGKYVIERKNENVFNSDRFINATLILMFLSEPRNLQTVFSERYGDFCELKTVSQGVYEVALPIGGSIRYYYKNGVCQRTESIGTLQDIQIKLRTK
jgi:hypothetical protein